MRFRKKIWLDNILGTLFIFLLMGLIFRVSQFGIFDAFDPIGKALDDMEMTDLVFSQIREDPEIDTNVVIVNISHLPRGGIGQQLNIINHFEPKVVGMDTFFGAPHEDDPVGDSILSNAIANTKNLVMVTKLLQSDSLAAISLGEDVYDSMEFSDPMFIINANMAFANLDTEAKFQEDYKACRSLPSARMVKDKQYSAFAVKMAELFDKDKADKFLQRNNDWEIINFRGNVVDYYGRTNYPTSYYALDWYQVLDTAFLPELIKDKIVIFGYLGDDFSDTSWDDKFFTPLNKNFAGKANPDMYGVTIHANVVSMILKEDYIETISEANGGIIAFLVCFLNVIFFSWIYRRLPRWYDGLTKLFQVMELAVLLFLMVMLFDWFSFKLNLTITFAAVALAGDSLEVYYGVVKNLFTKESRKQLFTIQR